MAASVGTDGTKSRISHSYIDVIIFDTNWVPVSHQWASFPSFIPSLFSLSFFVLQAFWFQRSAQVAFFRRHRHLWKLREFDAGNLYSVNLEWTNDSSAGSTIKQNSWRQVNLHCLALSTCLSQSRHSNNSSPVPFGPVKNAIPSNAAPS